MLRTVDIALLGGLCTGNMAFVTQKIFCWLYLASFSKDIGF